MDYLLITRADGRLSVAPHDPTTDAAAEVAKWASTADPSWLPVARWRVATNPDFPATDPDAWADDGANVTVSAALLAAITQGREAASQSSAVSLFADPGAVGRLQRAAALVVLDRVNELREWLASFKAAVAAATSLANLQTRVAALPNTPDYNASQIKTAIQNKIASIDSD